VPLNQNYLFLLRNFFCIRKSSVSDPDSSNPDPDPDPAFELNPDPDPDSDPDPGFLKLTEN